MLRLIAVGVVWRCVASAFGVSVEDYVDSDLDCSLLVCLVPGVTIRSVFRTASRS